MSYHCKLYKHTHTHTHAHTHTHISFIESTMCLDKKKAMRKGITVKCKTSLCFCFVAAASLTITNKKQVLQSVISHLQ